MYLTNPVFSNSLVAAAGPTIAGFGGGQPMNYPANLGQFYGQSIALGWREVRSFYGWLSSGW
jgi:hypothetical protein